MSDPKKQRTLREVLASDGDLRRKAQRAAVQAWCDVIKQAGYSFTPEDQAETQADLTATALAVRDSLDAAGTRDGTAEVIVAAGVATAIAAGGF